MARLACVAGIATPSKLAGKVGGPDHAVQRIDHVHAKLANEGAWTVVDQAHLETDGITLIDQMPDVQRIVRRAENTHLHLIGGFVHVGGQCGAQNHSVEPQPYGVGGRLGRSLDHHVGRARPVRSPHPE